ncbi:hypothetical protein MNAN1_002623 [Malassezia nana]|uniref:Uncharacterized protein n=1 Tax=Malassezia nana TaxID=180528 RepID=A0AAF0J331_9BASI|nr:hypothetical protein MNAN1_002623 [Malassezia nana]
MDDPRRGATRAPTPASLARYRRLYIRHVWHTQRVSLRACPRDPSWAWWAAWTPEERACFFRAVGRHSRLRPDLVARDVPTKSLLEIMRAIHTFDRHVRRVRRDERCATPCSPAARELSEAWIAWEESHAQVLAQRVDPRAVPSRDPISVAEQLFHLAWFLYRTRPGPAQPETESLAAILGRLVQLPEASNTLPTGPVLMAASYVAWARQYPVPLLTDGAVVAQVLRELLDQKFLAWSQPDEDPALRLNRSIVWVQDRCCPPLPHGLHEVLSLSALERRCAPGYSVPYRTWAGLAHELYAFLVPILYDVMTVAEHSHPNSSVDESAVWAAIARVGRLPSTETPTEGPLGLNRDLLDMVAHIRTVADPPVAWLHRPPTRTPGLVHGGSERVAETWETGSVSSEGVSDHASEDDMQSTQLGALRTIAPYEFTQGPPSEEELANEHVPQAEEHVDEHTDEEAAHAQDMDDTDTDDTDDTALDAHDMARDRTYEARLWHTWVEASTHEQSTG